MRICLTNGCEIENCEELVSEFYEKDAHGLYDRLEVPHNNELDLVSLASLAFFERQNPELAHWRTLEKMKPIIEEKLGAIPPSVSITDSEIPWNELTDLFGKFLAVDGFACARVSKILHKKRPHLIPILDRARVINAYYKPIVEQTIEEMHSKTDLPLAFLKQYALNLPIVMTALVKAIRTDILANRSVLEQIQGRLTKEGVLLSLVRIFDIILWEYAGREAK